MINITKLWDKEELHAGVNKHEVSAWWETCILHSMYGSWPSFFLYKNGSLSLLSQYHYFYQIVSKLKEHALYLYQKFFRRLVLWKKVWFRNCSICLYFSRIFVWFCLLNSNNFNIFFSENKHNRISVRFLHLLSVF